MAVIHDIDLLERWRTQSDAGALTILIQRHHAMVFLAARRIARQAAEAEDVTQEVFMRLAHDRTKFRVSVCAWLHRVATNLAIDRVRAARRRREREARWLAAQPTAAFTGGTDASECVDEAIEQLPSQYRGPIVDHFLNAKTHDQIARESGVSRSAITQRIQRGLSEMRSYMQARGVRVGELTAPVLLKTVTDGEVPDGLLNTLSDPDSTVFNAPSPLPFGGFNTSASSKAPVAITAAKFATPFLVVAGLAAVMLQPKDPGRTDPDPIEPPASILAANDEPDEIVSPVDEIVTVPTSSRTIVQEPERQLPEVDIEPEETVAAEPTGSLGGVITDKLSGMPLADLTVYARPILKIAEVNFLNSESSLFGSIASFDMAQSLNFQNREIQLAITETADDAYGFQFAEGIALSDLSLDVDDPDAPSAKTDAHGRYYFDALPEADYQLSFEAVSGYPETRHRSGSWVVGVSAVENARLNVALLPEGALQGRVYFQGKPLPNTTIRLDSTDSLPTSKIQTDAKGFYRLTDLMSFDASLRGRLQVNQTRISTPYLRTVVESGRTTYVDFYFATGTALIEGRVTYLDPELGRRPVSGRARLSYQVADGDAANYIDIDTEIDQDGYYRFEGLTAGQVLLSVSASSSDFFQLHHDSDDLIAGRMLVSLAISNSNLYRVGRNVDLKEGERAIHNITIHPTIVSARVANMPEPDGECWLVAFDGSMIFPDRITPALRSEMQERQHAVGKITPQGVGSLGGLPPGAYTIVAALIPAGIHPRYWHQAGQDVLHTCKAAYTYVTIHPGDTEVSVDLAFHEDRMIDGPQ